MADPKKNDVDTTNDEDENESSDSEREERERQRQRELAEKQEHSHNDAAGDKLGSEADVLFESKKPKEKKNGSAPESDIVLQNIFVSKQDKTAAAPDILDATAAKRQDKPLSNVESAATSTISGAQPTEILPDEKPGFRNDVLPDTMDAAGTVGKVGEAGRWDGFKIGVRSSSADATNEMLLPNSDALIIGRNSDSEIRIQNSRVSRRHAMITQQDGKVYIEDLDSTHGTFILRDGQKIAVPKGIKVELRPGDSIGIAGDLLLPWKSTVPKEVWKPAGYKAEKVDDKASESAKEQANIAASKAAREASNKYLKNHEYSGRIPDGFQVVGGFNQIDENGKHGDNHRPSVIVDTRPGKDPALEKFIEECKRDLAHLKDRPEELAREIAKRAKAVMQPAGWSEKAVDDGYFKLRAEHRGGQLMLGDFIEAAKRGEGAGVCNHQAILTKVAFDAMFPNDADRPQMKLVRGYCGDSPAGLPPDHAMNHAWTTLSINGQEKIFDPRQRIYGDSVQSRPSHQPGIEVPQLRPADAPAPQPRRADNAQQVYDRLIGAELGYKGQVWKVLSIDAKTGNVVIAGSGMRDQSMATVQALNPGRELRIGETYKVKRSDGSIDDGWRFYGFKDPATQKEPLFTKDFAYKRTVKLDELRQNNERVFQDAERRAEQKAVVPAVAPQDLAQKAKAYGLESGREVSFGGRKWVVGPISDGKIEIVRPSERIMGAEEFKRLNGDRIPKPGEEINYQRSTGEVQKWRVVGYDEATGEIRVRSETAVREKVSIADLLHENPDIREKQKSVDLRALLADPRTKVSIECQWSDGNSGHRLYLGWVEGPDGERMKVMIHKPPSANYPGLWPRAQNDFAAQKLAEKMGAPGVFPSTAMKDGMMIQKFVGREGEDLQSYLHDMSREDKALRAAYPHLDERVMHMMDKVDPKLRLELARAITFSALLGDHDQHGLNFVVERTGPNPGDVRIARIDTDYAFSKEGQPQIDRKNNYGGSVNGVFRYFSEKEIPAEIREQVKKISDELNPADPEEKKAARQKFASETRLTIEQVNALAERAKVLADTGRFPKSINLHAPEESAMKPGDGKVGSVRVDAPFDIAKATAALAKAGIKADSIAQLQAAYAELAKDPQDNQKALDDIKTLCDTTAKMDTRKRQALIDSAIILAKDKSIAFDLAAAVKKLDTTSSEAAHDLLKKVTELDKIKGDVGTELVERIKSDIAKLAPTQPDKIPELMKVLDKLNSPGFAKAYGPERLKAFADLLSIPEKNSLLEVPFSHFLDAKVSKEFISFAYERFKESASGFTRPAPGSQFPAHYEYNAGIAAMQACKDPINGRNLIFIPAANGSQADAVGMDGIFLDPATERIYPVDWTTNLGMKFEKQKAIWAASPSASILGHHTPGVLNTPLAATDTGKTAPFIDRFVGKKPSIGVKEFLETRAVFPSMGAAPAPSSIVSELYGLKRFLQHFDKNRPAEPLLAELFLRTKNALPHHDATKGLSDRLLTAFHQNLISFDRRPAPVQFNFNPSMVKEETIKGKDASGTPVEEKFRYLEIDLDIAMNRDVDVLEGRGKGRKSTITKVRLYEDGTIVGVREYDDTYGHHVKPFELGHISDFVKAIQGRLEATPEPRRTELLAKLNEMASQKLTFDGSNHLVQALGEAVTQSGPITVAANRVRFVDHITTELPGVDQKTAEEIHRRVGQVHKSKEVYQKHLDTINIENKFQIDTKTAESILSRRDAIMKSAKVDSAVAADAAALEILKAKAAPDALKLAITAAEVRAQNPKLSVAQALDIATFELSVESLMPEKSKQAEFRAILQKAIETAKPGEELKSIYENLKAFAHERALSDTKSPWFDTYFKLDEMTEKDFGKLLGLSDNANLTQQKESLSLIKERLKETNPETAATSLQNLSVNKSLLSENVIGRFYERMAQMSNVLKEPGADSGLRIKESIFEFLKSEGISDPLLNEANTEVEISKDISKPAVEYSKADHKKVIKIEGKFYLEDGKTPVDAAKVETKIILPEGMLRASSSELCKALYGILVEQTSQGPASKAAADRAGVNKHVAAVLEKQFQVPADIGTATSSGIEFTKLPPVPTTIAALEISANSIKIAGDDRDISFAELWSDRIKDLEKKLHAEEQKSENEQDKRKIAELKAAIKHEKDFVAELKIADPKDPKRLKAEARAREFIKGFRPAEADIERLAAEKGPGGELRGRLVALTILASAFIAFREKAAAAETPDTKSAVPKFAVPAHEEVPPSAPPNLSAAEAPDTMDGPAKVKVPNHEELADSPTAVPEAKPEPKPEKGKDPAKPSEKKDAGDPAKDATDKPPPGSLKSLTASNLMQPALLRLLPEINMRLAVLNAKNLADGKPGVDLVDEAKLREEWAKSAFGPESMKLWDQAKAMMEREPLVWMKALDQRGLQFPPGSPYGPGYSTSGSMLREGDALFRARLRNGEIEPNLNFSQLKPGEVPSKDDVEKFLKALEFTAAAQSAHHRSVLAGQVSYVDETLKHFPKKTPVDWQPPKDGTPEEMERWRVAALQWLETGLRVKTYAETIAAYHYATTTQGRDWPCLTDAFKGRELGKATVFSDAALKDPDFPGDIKRNPNGTIEVKIDMPEGLDRNNPAHIQKIEKMERWLAKWGPAVDQVTAQLTLAMHDKDRLLSHIEEGDVEREHKIKKKEEIESFRKVNPTLKGDSTDVGKFVNLPNGQTDWRITKLNADGSYELERHAPNEKPFNLKRSSFETVKCDRNGKENPNGEYVKVTGYQDYLWANWNSYNNWDLFPGSITQVHRKETMPPTVFHQNELVPILENGRMRVMPAGKLTDWRNAQENAKQTGNVINTVVDAGMLVTGLYEARAGWMVAKQLGETSMRRLAYTALKSGAWHFGLGATGFAKQAIENIPGGYGHEINKYRHYLILADISIGLLPASAQKAIWSAPKFWKWGRAGQEAESAIEAYKLGRVMAAGTEIPLQMKWYDHALRFGHKLYEGWKVFDKVPVVKHIPIVGKFPLGAFPIADVYFLAQFSDTLAALADKNDPQRTKMFDAMTRQLTMRNRDKPLYANPTEASEEQFKKAMGPTIREYSSRLGLSATKQNVLADQIHSAVNEAVKLPANNPDRMKLALKLAEDWKTAGDDTKYALAAGLLKLSRSADGKYPEQILGIKTSELIAKTERSSELINQKTSELIGKPISDAGRENYRQELSKIYNSASSPAEKAAAARALLELSRDADGKLIPLAQSAALDINKVKVFFDKTPEGMLARLPEFIMKDPDNADRLALGKDAAEAFRNANLSEKERVAAAMVLMSLRGGDTLNLGIAGTDVKGEELLSYLKDRVQNSESPEVKIAVGDLLFRTYQMVNANMQARAEMTAEALKAYEEAKEKLAKNPNDETLKQELKAASEELEEARAIQKDTHKFLKKVNYSGADFASTLMSVIESDKTPRQVKLEAIASTNGPRLAALLQHLKYDIEPKIHKYADSDRIDSVGGLYGRDSKSIEKFLKKLATDPTADKDVRAFAAKTLNMSSLDRITVNGVPMSPGASLKIGQNSDVKIDAPGVKPHHATIVPGPDGRLKIHAVENPVWIYRNEKYIPVGAEGMEIKAGDAVVIGDQETGKALFFSNESVDGLAALSAEAKTKGGQAGAIGDAYFKQLKETLETPLPHLKDCSAQKYTELIVARLLAADAAKNLGPEAFGLDKTKFDKLIGETIASCVTERFPELAIAALARLDASMMANMSIEKASALRSNFFIVMKNNPPLEVVHVLKESFIQKMPVIFESATASEKGRAQRTLEAILMPGIKENFPDSKKVTYPVYDIQHPAARVAALETLAKINPDKAAEIATVLLIGGDYNGKKISADTSAMVRLQAIKTLEQILPLEAHQIALKALRSEKDPAVLSHIWRLEYGQRPDLDPTAARKEVERIRDLIGKRSKPGFLEEGKKFWESFQGDHRWPQRALGGLASNSDTLMTPKAAEARKALLYLISRPENESSIELRELFDAISFADADQKKKLAEELCGPLETILMTEPSMKAHIRSQLLDVYLKLKPGENGIVNKDEAAVVLATVLEAELKRMPRIPFTNQDEYNQSLQLQQKIIDALGKLKSDKVAPLLDAISANEPIKMLDEQGRPKLVKYGDITRRFEYNQFNSLQKITEFPSGKVFTEDPKQPGSFVTKDGERIESPSVQVRNSRQGEKIDTWYNFNNFNVQGEFGDFVYKKDGKLVVQKPNGMVVEEELKDNYRKVTMTYPGGKESREFVFTKNGNEVNVVMTGKPDNTVHTWKIHYKHPTSPNELTTTGTAGSNALVNVKYHPTNEVFGGTEVPWNFDKGTYQYAEGKPNMIRYVDSSGAVYEQNGRGGMETKVKPGYGESGIHPSRNLSISARILVNSQNDTGELAYKAAQDQLVDLKKNPNSEFFGAPDATKLADFMGKAITNKESDGYKVCKDIHLAMLAKPIEGENDPRLVVLREALRDGSDMVRLLAAQYLMRSPVALDKEGIAATCADILKNGSSNARAAQARQILEQIKISDAELVERALAATPDAPRLVDNARQKSIEVKYQHAFEDIRKTLIQGRKDALTWDNATWQQLTEQINLGVLSWHGRWAAEKAAVAQMHANLGNLEKHIISKASLKEKEDQAKEVAHKQALDAVDSLILKAMQDGEDNQGPKARVALTMLIMSNGRHLALNDEERKNAVEKAIDAVVKICSNDGPGRGDMDWVVESLLTQRVDLTVEQKKKVIAALESLADPDKGKLSAEKTSNIAMQALEQEIRKMPKPNQPGYAESMEYQKRLLETIKKFGNKELVPALQSLSKEHLDPTVREAAIKAANELRERLNEGVTRVVNQMIASDSSTKYPAIRSADDQRTPLLVAALGNPKLSEAQRRRAAELLLSPENKGIDANTIKEAANIYATLSLKSDSDDIKFNSADKILDKSNPHFTDAQRLAAARCMGELSLKAVNEQIREKSALEIKNFEPAEFAAAAQGALDYAKSLKAMPDSLQKIENALEKTLEFFEASDRAKGAQASLIDAAVFANSSLGPQHPLSQKLSKAMSTLAENKNLAPIVDAADPRLAPLRDAIKSGEHNLKIAAIQIALQSSQIKYDSLAPQETLKMAADEAVRLALGDSADKPLAVSLMRDLRSENLDYALARLRNEFPKKEAYDLLAVMPKAAAQKLMQETIKESQEYVAHQLRESEKLRKSYERLLQDPKLGEQVKNYNKNLGQDNSFKVPPQLAIRPEVLQKHMDHLLKIYKNSERSPLTEAELFKAYLAMNAIAEAKSPQLTEMNQLVERAAIDMKNRPLSGPEDPRLPLIKQFMESPSTNHIVKFGFATAIANSDLPADSPMRALGLKALSDLTASKDAQVKARAEKFFTDAIAAIKSPIDKNDPQLKELLDKLPLNGLDKARLELASKVLSKDTRLTKDDYKLWADAWKHVISCIGSSDASAKAEAQKMISTIEKNNPNKIHLIAEFLRVGQTRMDGTPNNYEFWQTFKNTLDKFETPKNDEVYKFAEEWLRRNPNTGNRADDLEQKAAALGSDSQYSKLKLLEESIAEREKTEGADSLKLAQARMRYVDALMKNEGYYYNASKIKEQTELALAAYRKQSPNSKDTADLLSKAADVFERTREVNKSSELRMEATSIYAKDPAYISDYAQSLAKLAALQMRKGEMTKGLENVEKIHALLQTPNLSKHDKAMLYVSLYQNFMTMINTNKEGSREKALSYMKNCNDDLAKLPLDDLNNSEAALAFNAFWWSGQTISDNSELSKTNLPTSFGAFEKALEAGIKSKGEKDVNTIGLFNYYASILERSGEKERAKTYRDRYEKLMSERREIPVGAR